MTDKSLEDILDKVPKKTPPWAVGIVTIIITVATSLITIYVLSRDDVHQVIGWAQTYQQEKTAQDHETYSSTLNRILSLVDTNSTQIVELSKSLGLTQQQNIVLTARVEELERKASLIAQELKICETARDKCWKDTKIKE